MLVELQEKRIEARNAALEKQQKEQTNLQNKAAAQNRARQQAEQRMARLNRRR